MDEFKSNQDTVRSKASNLRLYEDGTNRLSMSLYLNFPDHMRESVNQSTVRSTRSALSAMRSSYDQSGIKSPQSVYSDRSENDRSSPNRDDNDIDRKDAAKDDEPVKLGTLKGVFFPCVQNILGIILFVRLGWIVGVGGIGFALLIAFLSCLSTFLTCLSLAAISTNGKLPAGGVYYMISRSLGPKWGGSVGILFYLSNVCASVLYVLGAIEILTTYVIPGMSLGSSPLNARVYGTVLIILLASIVLVGISLVNRTAIFFLAAVIIAILSSLIGIFASNRKGMPEGVTGFPGNFGSNWGPGFNKPDLNGGYSSETFFSLFGIFYPSVTGIMAGSNRSGNLKNPSKSIPIGTLAAQITTSTLYIMFIMLLGTIMTGELLRTKNPPSGLLVASVAWPHPLVVSLGCLFASLGAGLQCFVGAPRLLQAIAKDDLLPFLRFFTPLSAPVFVTIKGHTFCIHRGGEPRRALLLTLIIAEAITLIGSLDVVAPVVTMLYLICYLFVNLSTSLLGFLKEPNWRPSWRYYHWSVSFAGAVTCLVFMFLLNWYVALIALFVMCCLYFYIEYRGAKVHWGDGIESFHVHMAQQNLINMEKQLVDVLLDKERKRQKLKLKLAAKKGSAAASDNDQGYDSESDSDTESDADNSTAKNWRPQVVAFLDYVPETKRLIYPNILGFVSQLRKGGGLSIVTACIKGDFEALSATKVIEDARRAVRILNREYKTDSFTDVLVCEDFVQGITIGVQSSGLGVLRPNTVILPFPTNGAQFTQPEADKFVDLVRGLILSDKALLLVKNPHLFPVRAAVRRGTLDVYWILHDGGILTLIPYLLQKHRVWRSCGLRIFAIAQLDDNSVAMQEALIITLKALRIEYVTAEVLEIGDFDVSEFAYEKTVRMVERQENLRKMSKAGVSAQQGILLNAPTSQLNNIDGLNALGAAESPDRSHFVDLANVPQAPGASETAIFKPGHARKLSGAQAWVHKIRSKSLGSKKEVTDLLAESPVSPMSKVQRNLSLAGRVKHSSKPSISRFPSESFELQQWPQKHDDGTMAASTGVDAGPEFAQRVEPRKLAFQRRSSSDELEYVTKHSDTSLGSAVKLLDHAASESFPPLKDKDSNKSTDSLTGEDRVPKNLADIFNPSLSNSSSSVDSHTELLVSDDTQSPSLKKPLTVKFKETSPLSTPPPKTSLLIPEAMQELRARTLEKNRIEMMKTAIKLNSIFTKHSKDAALIMTNLPAPSPNQQSMDWIEYINELTGSLQRVVLVNGTGSEVVTSFF